MSPPTEKSRPAGNGTAVDGPGRNVDTTLPPPAGRADSAAPSTYDTLGAELGRRRAAAWRCPPLDSGLSDPLDRVADRRAPCDFALTPRELLGEVERCRAAGWARWELGARFLDPRTVAA
jgi:hypothetical protein